MGSLFRHSGARFSDCGTYRYSLWRTWGTGQRCLFLMLNPSTADEVENDPTVERCERRARVLGFGGLRVANLFALRSTDPSALKAHPDPIGPENDSEILEAARAAGMVVCAWGVHGKLGNRSTSVVRMLREAWIPLHVLKLNADGQPAHPLYLPYGLTPVPWETSEDPTHG